MNYKFYDSILDELSLALPQLEILQTETSQPYKMMLYQPKNSIEFTDTNIKNSSSTNADDKFLEYFKLAKSRKASLAINPEYSCPWNSIRKLIEDDILPDEAKLWVVGCESIKKEELAQFKTNYESDLVRIHFEPRVLENSKTFLDPLCYIFKAPDNTTGELKTVFLIQFKTQHMSAWANDIESNNLILGEDIYVLRNNKSSINLFTLICSDVESFKINNQFKSQLEEKWDYAPFIIINLQLNKNHRDPLFKDFRESIMKGYDKKEIIFLNWASGTKINGDPLIEFSGSSIQLRTNEIDITNEKFNKNHKKGIYYTKKWPNYHIYYLNSDEYIFVISNAKIDCPGIERRMDRRIGPKAIETYIWRSSSRNFNEIVEVNDGCTDYYSSIGCKLDILIKDRLSLLDKERLASVSFGLINNKGWYNFCEIPTLILDSDELIKRITFAQDIKSDCHREKYIECLQVIENDIISNDLLIPNNIKMFRANCGKIMFFEYKTGKYDYNFNLVTRDKKYYATGVYLGIVRRDYVERIFKKYKRILPFQSKKLLVVWYKSGTSIIPRYDLSLPRATDVVEDPDSVMRSE